MSDYSTVGPCVLALLLFKYMNSAKKSIIWPFDRDPWPRFVLALLGSTLMALWPIYELTRLTFLCRL